MDHFEIPKDSRVPFFSAITAGVAGVLLTHGWIILTFHEAIALPAFRNSAFAVFAAIVFCALAFYGKRREFRKHEVFLGAGAVLALYYYFTSSGVRLAKMQEEVMANMLLGVIVLHFFSNLVHAAFP